MSFKQFNFNPQLNEALDFMGFKEPTPVQQDAIPIIQSGKDLIACAQTGTGKTGAFLLPVLNRIANQDEETKGVNTLIIAPTRELALQIDQQIEAFAYFLGISSLPVYGGGDGNTWDQQKKALTQGADIIVATPGRFIAHLNLGYVNIKNLKHLILDEADRMLDMGF
ncbi:MAG: DEAD/DEAH box helicase, partial [Bacteroidota bacterium]